MRLYGTGGAACVGLAAVVMWGLNALNQQGRRAALLARRRALEEPSSEDFPGDTPDEV